MCMRHLKPKTSKTELLIFPTFHSNQSLYHFHQWQLHPSSFSKAQKNHCSLTYQEIKKVLLVEPTLDPSRIWPLVAAFTATSLYQATINSHLDCCNCSKIGFLALSLLLVIYSQRSGQSAIYISQIISFVYLNDPAMPPHFIQNKGKISVNGLQESTYWVSWLLVLLHHPPFSFRLTGLQSHWPLGPCSDFAVSRTPILTTLFKKRNCLPPNPLKLSWCFLFSTILITFKHTL